MSDVSTLENKLVYGFGDSIVYGHSHPEYCFLQKMSDKYGFRLQNYAVNGATVIDSANAIIRQIQEADAQAPDYIVFNGMTNDCWAKNENRLGSISQGFDGPFDTETLCGGFENMLSLMKERWPEAKLVYVAIHRTNSRLDEITYQGEVTKVQFVMQDLTQAMCRKWGVTIADLYHQSHLDTNIDGFAEKYIIDGVGTHPNELAVEKFYVPMVTEAMLRN